MGMTMTQKILAAHANLDSVEAGQLIEADLNLVLGNDITSPVAIHEIEKMKVDGVFDKDKIALVMDHFVPNKDIKSAEHCKCVREFAKKNEITNYFDVGQMGIEHALLPEQGIVGPGDCVIGAGCSSEGSDVLTVTEKGFGKRTGLDEYSVHNRGGLGVKNYMVTEKTGKIAAIRIVDETDDLLVITDDGTIIRVPVSGIRRTGRSAQGVRIMRLNDEAKVICVEKTEHFSEEEQPEEAEAQAAEESPDAE